MTFGIDIASSQRDIDIPRAKSEGVEFVVVKMGGLNVTPQYVAPHYRAQIDRVVAANLPKGHYYLIGGGQVWQTPTEQARFFVENLYRFDVAHDILMLDNEGLDSNGYLFDDAEAAEFMAEVIRLTGIRRNQVWHYAGANDYRNLGPWPLIHELGIRFVWAAYGSYPTGHLPDHEPSLQGSIPRWDVHQYSSLARVAGLNLDGNYSRFSVDELFGGVMPLNKYILRSPSTVIAADNRDPWVSWQNHLDRTSGLRGGVDIVAAVGTPVYARTSGVMLHIPNDGSAGNSCRFHHDANPGWKDVFSHLSAYVGESGRHFEAGEIVAYTGNSGGVTQHLHWHLVDPNGNRQNPWNYFSGSGTAGGGYIPVEDEMSAAAEAQINEIYNAIFNGGPSMEDDGNPIQRSLAQIKDRLFVKIDRPLDGIGNPGPVDLVQDLADTNSFVRQLIERGGAAVDLDALAEKIAAKIEIPTGGTPVDPAVIAKAVRAEFASNPLS